MAVLTRRKMLKALLGATGVAVAAQMNIPEWMGEEVRDEMIADLQKTNVSFSGVGQLENRPIWKSISGVRDVWAAEAARALGCKIDQNILDTCGRMARIMDDRLAMGEVTEDQVILVEQPRLVKLSGNSVRNFDRPNFQLEMGVTQYSTIFGESKIKVGWIAPSQVKLLDSSGRELA